MIRKVFALAFIATLLISIGLTTSDVLAQDQPWIEANISADWVAAHDFVGGISARLEVYDPGAVDPKCWQDFDLPGDLWMDCWDPLVQPGDVLKLYVDGSLVKEHIAYALTHDVFDPEAGIFSGTAPAGETVRVDYCNSEIDCGNAETVALLGDTWEINFGPDTVLPDASYMTIISDEDGDTTFAELTPSPNIDYNLMNNWLGLNGFPPNEDVLVEVYSDEYHSITLTTNSHGGAGWDSSLQLNPGDLIVADYGDGEIVKELTVEFVTIDEIDTIADTVSGRADPGTEVFVVIDYDIPVEASDTADGAGIYEVDFSGMTDLLEGMDVWAYVVDGDGDMTITNPFELASSPSMMVYPEFDWIDATGWPLGETVTLVIENDFNPDNGALYVTTGVPVPAPWNPDDSWIGFDLGEFVDLQPGQIVMMFWGDISHEHVITNLQITNVDVEASVVSGMANPGGEVHLMVNWDPETEIVVSAESDGTWTVDFFGVAELGFGDLINAGEFDDDGDSTWDNQLVVTPGGIIDEILNLPAEELAPEVRNSLIVKIENAFSSLAKGNTQAAVNKLEALIHQLNNLRGEKISNETADYLISLTNMLINMIE